MKVLTYQNAYGKSLIKGLTPEETLLLKLGEPYRAYREQWHKANAFELRPEFPIHLDVETVYACNLRCVMCPHGDQSFVHPPYKGRRLDPDRLKRVIESGVSKGLRSIRYSGLNEPLLYEPLIDVIAHAREFGVLDQFITSNGMLLTEDMSAKLVESGLTHLMVSLDAATAETYESIRIGAHFETVTRNVETFLAVRKAMGSDTPILRLSFVKMQANIHELDAFTERWSRVADHLAVVGYLKIVNDEERHERLTLNPGGKKRRDSFKCSQPWTRCAIFANGDVFPCCMDWGRRSPVGNILQRELADIWHSPEVRYIQDISEAGEFRKHPMCAQCVPKRDVFES